MGSYEFTAIKPHFGISKDNTVEFVCNPVYETFTNILYSEGLGMTFATSMLLHKRKQTGWWMEEVEQYHNAKEWERRTNDVKYIPLCCF